MSIDSDCSSALLLRMHAHSIMYSFRRYKWVEGDCYEKNLLSLFMALDTHCVSFPECLNVYSKFEMTLVLACCMCPLNCSRKTLTFAVLNSYSNGDSQAINQVPAWLQWDTNFDTAYQCLSVYLYLTVRVWLKEVWFFWRK